MRGVTFVLEPTLTPVAGGFFLSLNVCFAPLHVSGIGDRVRESALTSVVGGFCVGPHISRGLKRSSVRPHVSGRRLVR